MYESMSGSSGPIFSSLCTQSICLFLLFTPSWIKQLLLTDCTSQQEPKDDMKDVIVPEVMTLFICKPLSCRCTKLVHRQEHDPSTKMIMNRKGQCLDPKDSKWKWSISPCKLHLPCHSTPWHRRGLFSELSDPCKIFPKATPEIQKLQCLHWFSPSKHCTIERWRASPPRSRASRKSSLSLVFMDGWLSPASWLGLTTKHLNHSEDTNHITHKKRFLLTKTKRFLWVLWKKKQCWIQDG